MPYRDGTGPDGSGPLSGNRMGRCTGNGSGGGYGRNRGFGRGYGMGWGFQQTPSPTTSEKTWLDNVISAVKNQLQALEKRKSELKNE